MCGGGECGRTRAQEPEGQSPDPAPSPGRADDKDAAIDREFDSLRGRLPCPCQAMPKNRTSIFDVVDSCKREKGGSRFNLHVEDDQGAWLSVFEGRKCAALIQALIDLFSFSQYLRLLHVEFICKSKKVAPACKGLQTINTPARTSSWRWQAP